jgi:hypothetical protein
MTQTDSVHSTPPLSMPTDTNRRRFLTVAAAASAVAAGSLAVAAMPPAPQDDRRLLELEEKIFEEWRAGHAYDAEIQRLDEIWTAESKRLYQELLSREMEAGTYLTPQARWALVTDTPECREHSRLIKLQEPFYERMEELIKQMFATQHTRQKVAEPRYRCFSLASWAMIGAALTRRLSIAN